MSINSFYTVMRSRRTQPLVTVELHCALLSHPNYNIHESKLNCHASLKVGQYGPPTTLVCCGIAGWRAVHKLGWFDTRSLSLCVIKSSATEMAMLSLLAI